MTIIILTHLLIVLVVVDQDLGGHVTHILHCHGRVLRVGATGGNKFALMGKVGKKWIGW